VIFSREALERAWQPQSGQGAGLVEGYVGQLRRKLGPDSIETVPGVGYRLRPDGIRPSGAPPVTAED
jgi:DNA-binding response OmpR family regulator